MGFLSRLFGNEDEPRRSPRDVLAGQGAGPLPGQSARSPGQAQDPDAQAVQRYRYMIQTAPPETIEQAHAEAFAKLTPEQRQKVLQELALAAPASERAQVAATSVNDPQALARVATRAEVRQPGTMERVLGGGMGIGASLLSSFAMGFVGSMVAQSFFSALGGFGDGGSEASADEGSDASADDAALADQDADYAADEGDLGGDDFGGDFEV